MRKMWLLEICKFSIEVTFWPVVGWRVAKMRNLWISGLLLSRISDKSYVFTRFLCMANVDILHCSKSHSQWCVPIVLFSHTLMYNLELSTVTGERDDLECLVFWLYSAYCVWLICFESVQCLTLQINCHQQAVQFIATFSNADEGLRCLILDPRQWSWLHALNLGLPKWDFYIMQSSGIEAEFGQFPDLKEGIEFHDTECENADNVWEQITLFLHD